MKPIKQISAILLACLVLVSSTSFMIGFHYCKGEVKSIGFFQKADQCAKASKPACHRHLEKSCCDDEQVLHEGSQFSASHDHVFIDGAQPVMEVEPLRLLSLSIPLEVTHFSEFRYYDPPLRHVNLTIAHHALLI